MSFLLFPLDRTLFLKPACSRIAYRAYFSSSVRLAQPSTLSLLSMTALSEPSGIHIVPELLIGGPGR